MTNVAMEVGSFLLATLFGIGPVLGLALLLNARDRRRAALLEATWSLTPRELRHLIAIQVHCGLLLRRSAIRVDMRDCTRDEIWGAIERWSAGLPPGVRLVVNGGLAPDLAARVTVEPARRQALWLSYCFWTTTRPSELANTR